MVMTYQNFHFSTTFSLGILTTSHLEATKINEADPIQGGLLLIATEGYLEAVY